MVHHKVLHLKKILEAFALVIEKKTLAILCKLHCTVHVLVVASFMSVVVVVVAIVIVS